MKWETASAAPFRSRSPGKASGERDTGVSETGKTYFGAQHLVGALFRINGTIQLYWFDHSFPRGEVQVEVNLKGERQRVRDNHEIWRGREAVLTRSDSNLTVDFSLSALQHRSSRTIHLDHDLNRDLPLGKGADDDLRRCLIMVQPTIHHLFRIRFRFCLTDKKMGRVPASWHVEEVIKV